MDFIAALLDQWVARADKKTCRRDHQLLQYKAGVTIIVSQSEQQNRLKEKQEICLVKKCRFLDVSKADFAYATRLHDLREFLLIFECEFERLCFAEMQKVYKT